MALTNQELQEQLTALEKAYYSGTLRVKYADREVSYRTLDEMQKIMDNLQKRLGINKGMKFIEMNFDNGLK